MVSIAIHIFRLIAVVAVFVQCAFIFKAATYLPTGSPLLRLDCVNSVGCLCVVHSRQHIGRSHAVFMCDLAGKGWQKC
jgi:hypothetical protein